MNTVACFALEPEVYFRKAICGLCRKHVLAQVVERVKRNETREEL